MISDVAVDTLMSCPLTTVLLTHAGSHAFGLDTPESDHDFSGVFLLPLEEVFSVGGIHGRETVRREAAKGHPADLTLHEVGKFCRLAAAGNPTVLETLYAKRVYTTRAGELMVDGRGVFLSKRSLKPYFGYYESQRSRLERGQSLHTRGGEWNPKFACHMIRLLIAAEHLALYGTVLTEVHGSDQALLMSIKLGEVDQEDCLRLADRLLVRAREAEAETSLPDEMDMAGVNKLLYDIRMGKF